jgi:hypothetical protein
MQTGIDSGRPYRSHLYPACLPCKKRKSRCRTRDLSGTCIMCQAHGTHCVFPQADYHTSQQRAMTSPRRLAAKVRHSSTTSSSPRGQALLTPGPSVNRPSLPHSPQGLEGGFNPQNTLTTSAPTGGYDLEKTYTQILGSEETPSNLRGIVAETGENSSHIISPAVADDSEFLESYLSTIPDAGRTSLIRTSVTSSRPMRPVLFSTVPRRPLGVSSNQSLPATKCEVIEKYLEPAVKDVVNL